MAGKRFTDEQMSRILSEHAVEQLTRHGASNWRRDYDDRSLCCVNQAAYNEPSVGLAASKNRAPADWFDWHYTATMSPRALAAALDATAHDE